MLNRDKVRKQIIITSFIVALVFCWLWFSWLYFVSREDYEIKNVLKKDVQIISNEIKNEVTQKQAAIDRLAHRLIWLHSLNYTILENDVGSYFQDFPSLWFILLHAPNDKNYSFFQNDLPITQVDYYLKLCQSNRSIPVVCLTSENKRLLAVFNEKHVFEFILNQLKQQNLAISVSENARTVFSTRRPLKKHLKLWIEKRRFEIKGIVWEVSVGLTHEQLRQMHDIFPLVYFILGTAISLLLLYVFYYVNVTILKNKVLNENEKTLKNLVAKDHLTGALNRKSLMEVLSYDLKRAKQNQLKIAVIFVDLDDFKSINDKYGHAIGDIVLKNVCDKLKVRLREFDHLARVGGDEFVITLGGKHLTHDDIEKIAAQYKALLDQPLQVESLSIKQTISLGVAIYSGGEATADTLLKQADAAMYIAKKEGKNKVAFYDQSVNAILQRNNDITLSLREAAPEFKGFSLYYQPQFKLAARRIIGVEALIRWQHPTLGNVPPEELITIAEANKVIVPLGMWILKKAMEDWHKITETLGYEDFRLSVNISPVQLIEADVVAHIQGFMHKMHFPADQLILEITETAVIDNIQGLLPTILKLKKQGVRFALDDFGKGYSSINHLINIPLDYVKIDKAFTMGIHGNKEDVNNKAIVSSIITLASKLNLITIAEGIETQEQYDYLKELKCEKGQGYYFSRPLSLDDLLVYLKTL